MDLESNKPRYGKLYRVQVTRSALTKIGIVRVVHREFMVPMCKLAKVRHHNGLCSYQGIKVARLLMLFPVGRL